MTQVGGRAQLTRLKAKLAQVVTIDFFGANGRETVDGLLTGLETKLTEGIAVETSESGAAHQAADLAHLKDRTWVTREGVHVDRIACAWLIRRFIDRGTRFKFVPGNERSGNNESEFWFRTAVRSKAGGQIVPVKKRHDHRLRFGY
jgi:hypothetical protein